MNLFETGDVIPGGAGKVLLGEIIQGEQFPFVMTLRDENQDAIDLSDYVLTAKAKFYQGAVTGTGNSLQIDRASVQVHDPVIPDLDLVITKTDQTVQANHGKFSTLVPADLYERDIDPIGNVFPIIAMFWTISNGATTPMIDKQRINLVLRFGG